MSSYVKVDFQKEGISYFQLRAVLLVELSRAEYKSLNNWNKRPLLERIFSDLTKQEYIELGSVYARRRLERLARIFDLAEFGPVYLSGEDLEFINKYRE